MFTNQWVKENFGQAEWLGAGSFGEAWRITFEGRTATLKITGSEAEKFCVEAIKDIQPDSSEYDPLFPFPYIFLSGPIVPPLDFDLEWYESPLVQGTYFYIREFAKPLQRAHRRRRPSALEEEILPQLRDLANDIYREYGLILMDLGAANWGYVQRGAESVLVPIDLACGTREHWLEQFDEEGYLNVRLPFEPPDWLRDNGR